jgi:hypothetical protein
LLFIKVLFFELFSLTSNFLNKLVFANTKLPYLLVFRLIRLLGLLLIPMENTLGRCERKRIKKKYWLIVMLRNGNILNHFNINNVLLPRILHTPPSERPIVRVNFLIVPFIKITRLYFLRNLGPLLRLLIQLQSNGWLKEPIQKLAKNVLEPK